MSLIARWDIISYCNLKCIHCRSEEFYDGERQVYPSLDAAIDTVDTLVARGVGALNILGGEPFAFKHLYEVMRHARDRGVDIYVTTNGTLLREQRIDELLQLGLKQITVSLDGSCPEVNDAIRGRGVFEKATRSLGWLLEGKRRLANPLSASGLPTICVNCVLTKANQHDVGNLIRYCAGAGVDMFRLSPLDEIGNARDHLPSLWVSPREQLAVAEELMPLVAIYPSMRLEILDLKPLVLEYLYEKTGIPLNVGVVGCSACTKEIYVQPAGFVSPCLATAKQSQPVVKGVLDDYVQPLHDLRGAAQADGLVRFQRDFRRTRAAYANYVPCNECGYAGSLCKPCPLGSVRKGPVMQEMCVVAKDRLAALKGGMGSKVENTCTTTM